MLSALSTGTRFRFAIALAAFAALCFALPPAVLAMGHGANTMACLSHADEVNHGMAYATHKAAPEAAAQVQHAVHVAVSARGGAAPSSAHPMTCCGLFCLNAILASGSQIAAWPTLGVPYRALPAPRFLSRVPELPERPPNTLLSV
jgi:hypothetical protein